MFFPLFVWMILGDLFSFWDFFENPFFAIYCSPPMKNLLPPTLVLYTPNFAKFFMYFHFKCLQPLFHFIYTLINHQIWQKNEEKTISTGLKMILGWIWVAQKLNFGYLPIPPLHGSLRGLMKTLWPRIVKKLMCRGFWEDTI